MDYERIYRDFIASRKRVENDLQGYTEKHHILPRSFGGSDDPDNLVKLTPEDHFFAHLLLAKIHGGKMGSALFFMLQKARNHWGRRIHSRARYGLAARMALPGLVEGFSGENNPKFNGKKYKWVNYRTGDKRTATMFEMHRDFGCSRPQWTNVATGARPSVAGWLLASNLKSHKRSEKGQAFDFVNRDGREFRGTQSEFCQHTGLNDASSWRIVHQRSVTRCGWRLRGVVDRGFNCPRDGTRSGPKPKIITLIREQRRISWDRHEIARLLGSTPQQVSAAIYMLRTGKAPSYKGWSLEQIHSGRHQVWP